MGNQQEEAARSAPLAEDVVHKPADVVYKELKGAKLLFWVASVTFVMMLTTGRMVDSNPHMTSAAFLMWCAFIVSDIMFVRKAYRTAKVAGFSAIAWGAVTWAFPLSVWALNGKVKRVFGPFPVPLSRGSLPQN